MEKEAALAHIPAHAIALPNLYQEERRGDHLFPDASSQIVGLATAILAREKKISQVFLVTDCSGNDESAVAPRTYNFIRAQFENEGLPEGVEFDSSVGETATIVNIAAPQKEIVEEVAVVEYELNEDGTQKLDADGNPIPKAVVATEGEAAPEAEQKEEK